MMTRFALLLIAFAVCAPTPAHANIFEFLFPSLKKEEYNPYETLTAPFANDDASKQEREKTKIDDLTQPHRTARELSTWLGMRASDLLTFKADTYKADLRAVEPELSTNGLSGYTQFLTQNSFMKVLDSGQYDITAIKQGEPLLLNEGRVKDSYKWLFEVPVMVSYIKRNTTDYKNVQPVNRNFKITLQLGRTQDAPNDHNVLIETFSGKPQP